MKFLRQLVKVKGVYGLASFCHAFFHILMDFRWEPLLGAIISLSYVFKKKRLVIVYLEIPSHEASFFKIPNILASRSSEYQLMVLCGFDVGELSSVISDVRYISNVRLEALAIYFSSACISTAGRASSATLPFCSKNIYLPHSLVDIDGVFPENTFDAYHYILCAGRHHMDDFARVLNRRRGNRTLIPFGYPKLDQQIDQQNDKQDTSCSQICKNTIIYAPTLVNRLNENLASLRSHGEDIVATLTKSQKVIFRPHPASLKNFDDSRVINKIKNSRNSSLKLDVSKDYFKTFAQSSLMVTDLSGSGFTYAFSTGKPVIFFAHNAEKEQGRHGIQYEGREGVGKIVRNTDELNAAIKEIENSYESYQKKVLDYRKELMFNVEKSSEQILAVLDFILKNEEFDGIKHV